MIPYMGGKSSLAKWIISNFPEDYENRLYVEPFGGGGWVLFRKKPSANEVYNDLHKNLVRLFKVIRDQYPEFLHKVKWTFHSREMYNEAKAALLAESIPEVDHALSYLIVKAQSFSANESTYGYALEARHRPKWGNWVDKVEGIRDRMRYVNIECLDFEKLIDKYDTDHTLFYVDPPYVSKEHYYKVPFGIKDHERLAGILKAIKGKFALSYYPHDVVTRLYKGFRIEQKQATKFSCGITRNSKIKKRPVGTELLIMNY